MQAIRSKPRKLAALDTDQAAAILVAAVKQMQSEAAAGPAPDDEITFNLAFDKYMTMHARPHLAPTTIGKTEGYYRLYLRGPLGARGLSSIGRRELHELHIKIADENGRTAANRALELVRAVYNKAIDWELYEGKNPAINFRRFRLPQRERFLQPSELARFFKEVEAIPSRDTRDFIYLALYTGARKSNLLTMRWEEIDFEGRVWHIPVTKNGTPQTVPLIPQAIEVLERRRATVGAWGSGQGFVFATRQGAGSGHYENPYRAWKKLCIRAKLPNLRIHDLRRSMGSWEALTGANLPVIGRTLNHTDLKSTAIYARVNLAPVRAAMEKAVAAMQGAAGMGALNHQTAAPSLAPEVKQALLEWLGAGA